MSEPDDRTLVRDALSGDREALERLVGRHQQTVFSIAYRISRDREDARDITQLVFVRACEKLPTYDARFKFFSWLYRIAVNESLRLVERRRPQTELDPNTADDGRVGPDAELEADRMCRDIRAAVASLPELYREVIYLRHFAELSYADVSEALGVPEKTVKSRLFTARRQLRDTLVEWNVEGPWSTRSSNA